MRKFLIAIGIFFVIFVNSANAQPIISCDANGFEKNTFYTNETVYLRSTTNITATSQEVYIYIVNDIIVWTDGVILNDVSGGRKTNTTNSSGYLEVMKIWSPSLTVGNYDIVVDVNKDGAYNISVDYVDNFTTPGFEVVETPVPTLDLSLGPNTPPNHDWNLGNNSDNVMLQMKLAAGPVEDVKINSIALVASGTGDDKNGINFASLISDDGNGVYDQGDTLLSFGKYIKDDGVLVLNLENYVIPANKTAYMLVIYSMSNFSSHGSTYNFQVASVSATGANSGVSVRPTGLPITSATKTVIAATNATTTTSSTTTTSTTTTSLTTTSSTTTTTSPYQLPKISQKYTAFILIVSIVLGVVMVAIVFVVAFIKKKQASETKFEELKEKWSQ